MTKPDDPARRALAESMAKAAAAYWGQISGNRAGRWEDLPEQQRDWHIQCQLAALETMEFMGWRLTPPAGPARVFDPESNAVKAWEAENDRLMREGWALCSGIDPGGKPFWYAEKDGQRVERRPPLRP